MENIIRKLKNDEVDVQYIRVEAEMEEELKICPERNVVKVHKNWEKTFCGTLPDMAGCFYA